MAQEPNRESPAETSVVTAPSTGLTRRRFLLSGGLFAVGLGALGGVLGLQPTLTALVDTIIPHDEFGPSASQVGAVEAVSARMGGSLRRQLRLRVFLAWLNLRSGGSFAAASEDRRLSLLNKIASGPQSSSHRRYLRQLREYTMHHYYGSASRAVGLGFVGPPQPDGHLDAHLPWTGNPT